MSTAQLPSINKPFRALAALQGVEVGSPEFNDAGPMPESYTTGGQSHYPWKLDHKVSPGYIAAALANFGIRPNHYWGVGKRGVGYENAGRPVGWVADDPFDVTEGWQAGMRWCFTSKGMVLVNGVDLQHFHLTPLIAIYDAKPVPVKNYPELNSRFAAACLIRSSFKSLAGMVANLSTAPSDYPGDRASTCIIKATAQVCARGLFDVEDLVPIVAYIERALTHWEGPPHKYQSTKYADSVTPKVETNKEYVLQIYNGLYTVTPAIHMLLDLPEKVLPASNLRVRLVAILGVFCKRIEIIESLVPGGGAKVAAVSFPDSMLGVAPQDWSKLTTANLHYTDNAEWWAYRAHDTARKTLGSDALAKSCKALAAKYAATEPGWIVDADGAYVAAAPVGTK